MIHAKTGAHLLVAAGLLGAAVSIYNYFDPGSGINDTGGALLVIGSAALIGLLGWLLGRPRGTRWAAVVACAVLLLGTAFAAWLLNSPTLLALMALGAIGWFMQVFARRPAAY